MSESKAEKPRQDAESSMAAYERLDGHASAAKKNAQDSCVRKMVMWGNLLFLLLSAVVIAIGYYLNRSDAGSFTKQQLGIGLMVLGGFTLLVSFLGCCGAMQRSRCFVKLYVIILLLLIIAQAAIGAFIVTEESKVDTLITDKWSDTDVAGRSDFQNQFSCCGLFAFNDTNAVQPCPNDSTLGCVQKLKSNLQSQYRLAGGIALAFALVEVFGLLFACILMRQLAPPTTEQLEAERLRQAREVNRKNYS